MTFKFNTKIYDIVALLKSSYHYTDKAYIHLDIEDEYYVVDIEMKDDAEEITEKDFINTILSEMVRMYVLSQTKQVRELIMARAFSSTVIENKNCEIKETEDFNIDDILVDWFESNE